MRQMIWMGCGGSTRSLGRVHNIVGCRKWGWSEVGAKQIWKIKSVFLRYLHLLCSTMYNQDDTSTLYFTCRKSYVVGYYYPVVTWQCWGQWLDNLPRVQQQLGSSAKHWNSRKSVWARTYTQSSQLAAFPQWSWVREGRKDLGWGSPISISWPKLQEVGHHWAHLPAQAVAHSRRPANIKYGQWEWSSGKFLPGHGSRTDKYPNWKYHLHHS